MAFTMTIANAQSKKEQIENLTFSLDSLNQVVLSERQKFSITLDSLNQVIRKNQDDFELEMDKSVVTTRNLNTQLMRLISMNDSINTQLTAKDQKIDSLTLQIGELLKEKSALSSPQIDRENDWLMIESNIEVRQKDVDQLQQWLKMVVKPQELNQKSRSEFENIFTSNCYSYIEDAADFYWGYPGSIEEDELKSKWHSTFDLKYAKFGHAFENGNCGWATMNLRNIDFLGVLNGGDWFKLTITGGCGENDYSQTLIRIVKVIEKNGSWKIANFLSLQNG